MSDTERRLEKKFWDELDHSPFVMLGLQGVDDDFTRPMTAQVEGGTIYFCRTARAEVLPRRHRRLFLHFSRRGPERTSLRSVVWLT